ncbi:hypothetical protein ACGFNU_07460 [Spirillospora sp. NPDC048911]|uniref:hypothetical protein n=1 Tax=Spirillospora sp. NPDC048911 TaxID=3364527 RepID=UPI0037134EA1
MAAPYVRSLAPALIGLLLLAGCGWGEDEVCALSDCESWTPEPKNSIPADTLTLRWRMTGGFAGLGGPGSIPEFSLYGDGRAVAPQPGADSPVSGLAEFQLTRDALKRLLDDARAAGLGRSRTAGPEDIADAQALEITMGESRTRIIQPDSQPTDPAVRLWKRLQPSAWPAADQEGPHDTYAPPQIAVISGETTSSGKLTRPWPLAPLGQGEQAAGGVCKVMSTPDSATARKLVPDTYWQSQGKTYSVRVRPLLPDEHTCKDVARA